MNELNSQQGARVIDATAIFAGGRHLDARTGRPEKSVWAAIRSGVAEGFASLHEPGRPRVIASLLRSMRDRVDWQGSAAMRRKSAIKYIIRALCMPRQHAKYLAFVSGHPRMRAYQRRDPRVQERHFHRYIHLRWNRSARLRSMQQHYRFALSRLPGGLFEAIYIHGNAVLGSLTLKDGSSLKLCLRPPISMGCEGELCIQLSDAHDHPVYRIILSVIDEQPTLAIGCIQGPDGEHGKERVRELTKNMYGMRPKQLMLSLAYALAGHFGIERILAVSNAAHPLRRARDRFQADYDAFWQEQQGRDIGNGWFQLPATPSRKSEAEVSSQHRSAFRRREALRMDAEQLLIGALESFPVARRALVPITYAVESGRLRQDAGLKVSWIHGAFDRKYRGGKWLLCFMVAIIVGTALHVCGRA